LRRDGWSLRAPDGALAPVAPATLTATLRARAVGEPLHVVAEDALPYATLVDALDRTRAAGVHDVLFRGEY
jgi:hypothetical protein